MKQTKRWEIAAPPENLVNELSESLHISKLLATILINRNLTTEQLATAFLQADQQVFGDPLAMKGMTIALERLVQAINGNEKITIYGDYDVDGITATVVMMKVLTDLDANVTFYIPERQSEGYGIHSEALQKIVDDGTKLLITVDCGISAVQEVTDFKEKIDIIITDHHSVSSVVPPALAILNPKQVDCNYPEKNLAGVGVAYKLCQAIWQKLRHQQLNNYLEIVALGTIADIVALTGENRLIVKRGLSFMATTENVGLRALINVCGLAEKLINSGHVGFMLAPRLNAAGRLEHAAAAVELLITNDKKQAEELAQHLNRENLERQTIEKDILVKAEANLHKMNKITDRALVVAGHDWNSGVIGIVASRLVEAYYRPTVVISIKDGIGKGSCRSIAGFHMFEALQQCADLLVAFGGHAQAAGLTILPENISLFEQRLIKIASATLTEEDYTPVLQLDGKLSLPEITFDLIAELEKLEPYGMGNPRPIFACQRVSMTTAKAIGADGAHLRFAVEQNMKTLDGVAWNLGNEASELLTAKQVDIAFQPEINEWKGHCKLQLKAQSIRPVDCIVTEIDKLFLANEQNDRFKNIDVASQFFTKAVGVTFDNRQDNIAKLTIAEQLKLQRQPDNIYDKNAIIITTMAGLEIGYLRREIAEKLASHIDNGDSIYRAQVADITGDAASNFGVNIFVWQEMQPMVADIRRNSITLDEARQFLLADHQYHDKQKLALQALANGENTLVIMGTGRGKSAIFQTKAVLDAINNGKMTIILYPLRALVNDQYLNLVQRLKPLGINVYKGNGTISVEERGALFAALQDGTIDILLTTPEFLSANRRFIKQQAQRIGFFVVDEAHHLADGKRRPAYQQLCSLLAELGYPPSLGVTATATETTAISICTSLAVKTTIIDKTVRANLQIHDERNVTNKMSYLKDLIKRNEKVLIFVNSRKKAVEIASELRQAQPSLGEKIGFYHGGLSNSWRVKVENWFKDGILQVVVATSAFGEGIDLPDIRHVVQYHLPFNMTSFNQQCGRAGRDGGSGLIHLLFGQADIKLNNYILADRAPDRDTIGRIYLILKRQQALTTPISLTNAEIMEQYNKQYNNYIGEGAISTSLKIMEELKLIYREKIDGVRQINWNDVPKGKQLSLMQSATYLEGLNEREDFAKFSMDVLHLPQKKLLSWLNKPIYPINEWYNGTVNC